MQEIKCSILKFSGGTCPLDTPRRPVGFTFGPVGSKVIENPEIRFHVVVQTGWITICVSWKMLGYKSEN